MSRFAFFVVPSTIVQSAAILAQDRMPAIPPEKVTDAQKKTAQDYKKLQNQDLAGPPWSVILRLPDLVVPSLQLRIHSQNDSAFKIAAPPGSARPIRRSRQ